MDPVASFKEPPEGCGSHGHGPAALMRAKIVTLLIILAILTGAAYAVSGAVLAGISDKVIDYFAANITIPNVIYTRPVFRSVRFSGPRAITWENITADLTIVRDEVLKRTEKISVGIDELTIAVVSIPRHSLLLRFKGLSATVVRKTEGVTSPGSQNAPNRVEGGDLQMVVRINVTDLAGLRAQADELAKELKRFSREGVTKIPMQFSGEQRFILKGKPYTVKVRVEKEGGEYRLVMDETSLEQLGNKIAGISVTSGDRKILAENPLRMPQLLRIRDKADTIAHLAKEANPEVPEDAYRHVLWSYLLAKAYGEEFARRVCEAHESEADSEELKNKGKKKMRAAQYQDFVNNAVGRSYALKGYSESSILGRMMTDPAVIKDNEIKKRYDPEKFARYKKAAGQSTSLSK